MVPHLLQILWPGDVFFVLRNWFLKHFSLYFQYKNSTHIVAVRPWLEETLICTTWGCFHSRYSFIDQLDSNKKIFIHCIFLCKKLNPPLYHCSPNLDVPTGIVICTKLNLHWGCLQTTFSFLAKKFLRRFLKILTNIQKSQIYSTLYFIFFHLDNLNFVTQRCFVLSLIKIGPVIPEEKVKM